jgi:hypothetical protein
MMSQFEKYLLVEAITPIQTNYGLNPTLDDKEWDAHGNMSRTYFEYTGRIFAVDISSDGDVSFGTAKYTDVDTTKLQDPRYTRTLFTTLSMGVGINSSSIFNRVFYVLLEGLKTKQPKILKFSASLENPKLTKFYDFLISNSNFKDELSKNGYKVYGKVHNDYIIQRI